MEAVTNRRLPGVYFQVVQPPPEAVLPRMDIAGFVGFSARGPVNRPVAIEDPRRFRDVFGGEMPLVWDPVDGKTQSAHLAPAVEAFFRNGGRRCWVVRVADGAHTNTFPLAGLIDADSGRPALIDARCPGSWSNDVRVGTVLRRRLLGIVSGGSDRLYLNEDGTYELAMQTRSDVVRPGDVLKLAYDTGEELYLTVAARKALQSGKLRITGLEGRWFRSRFDTGASPPDSVVTRDATAVLVSGRDAAGDAALPACTVQIPTGENTDGFEVLFDTLPQPVPGAGDVLHLNISANPPDQRELWLSVREAHLGADPDSLPDDSLPGDSFPTEAVRIEADAGLWPMPMTSAEQTALVASLQDTPFAVERVTMRLVTWNGREIDSGIDDLGLSGWLDMSAAARRFAENLSGGEIATRFWGRLPNDDALFSLKDGLPLHSPPLDSLEREAFEPRFPLAGPAAVPPLCIPLAMADRPDPALALGRLPDGIDSTLEQDGLTNFGASLFLDEDLQDVRITTLPALAEDKLYLRGEALNGVHSLLSIDEVTLLSVPDAAHRGWVYEEKESVPVLAAPVWEAGTPEWLDDPAPCLPGVFRLCWTSDVPSASDPIYELEESTRPDFATKVLRHSGGDTCAKVLFEGVCTELLYYRVRVKLENRQSPWSAPLRVFVPEPDFTGDEPLDAPDLKIDIDFSLLEGELQWSTVPQADRYTLQVAGDPAFFTANEVKRSDSASIFYQVAPLPESVTFFRVRAEREDEVGPWSETAYFEPPPRSDWVARSTEAFHDSDSRAPGELLALHRALLRFCAARGDMLAVLSLPSHYREQEAFAHVAALTPDRADDDRFPLPASQIVHTIPGFSLDEGRVLSYGALYHPWTALRDDSRREGSIRISPPDGAVAGVIATKAITRGAWIAPANVPIAGAVAVEPEIDLTAWQAWLNASINLVMRDPRGFSPMSADTLSSSAELRPVSVRRLLILLRRLALREGNKLVFESNSAELRRRVRLQFLGLLSDLFERGAFLGDTPEQAFRVETGTAVNPIESIDRGRLVVELRVAPSRPLSFITVRLIQRDGSGFNVEEF